MPLTHLLQYGRGTVTDKRNLCRLQGDHSVANHRLIPQFVLLENLYLFLTSDVWHGRRNVVFPTTLIMDG